MTWFLILSLLTTQTLAPPPINFTFETVEFEGKKYDISFDGHTLEMMDHKPTNRIKKYFERNIIWEFLPPTNGKPKMIFNSNDPPDEPYTVSGCWLGCLCMTASTVFTCWVVYVVVRWIFR